MYIDNEFRNKKQDRNEIEIISRETHESWYAVDGAWCDYEQEGVLTDKKWRNLPFVLRRRTQRGVSDKSAQVHVLRLPDDDYQEIMITDPHLLREFDGDKLAIIDVKLHTGLTHEEVESQGFTWENFYLARLRE